ncbi:MAG: hypothetical protein JRI68_19950 [Deltaproteobacteria bacterium]|nr:hypothetical protein [Deltaproteobacteria bacterium]
MTKSLLASLALAATVAMASMTGTGCGFGGGLNDNIHNPGDEPGGVNVAAGNIAVAPSGDYFLFERENKLAVGWVATGAVNELPVNDPARLAFSKQRRFVYVTTQTGQLKAVDVDARAVTWSAAISTSSDALVVSTEDDSRVAVGAGGAVELFDAASGAEIASQLLDNLVVDLEVLPDDERLLVVERHEFVETLPTTTLHVIELDDGTAREFEVPNCSDNIIVPSHGEIALLAPTTCSQDPISIIDLTAGAEQFVRNLPGFGPVALGPDGTMAVGFLDKQLVDVSLFDDPEQIPTDQARYHLMVIDTETLGYDFYPWGENLPRYAMTPDGSVLLVDQSLALGSARLFDLDERVFVDLQGPQVTFEHLTFSGDSHHAYLLSDLEHHTSTSQGAWIDYQLYDLDIPTATVELLPTDFRPRNLNLAPGADKLFLRKDAANICIYSLELKSCERMVALTTVQ